MNIRQRLNKKPGIAGILAAVLMFAMLFTAGLGFFVYINRANLLYDQALANRNETVSSAVHESLTVTTSESGTHLALTVENTGGYSSQVQAIFVTEPSEKVVELNGSATSPALPITINPGVTSATINTGITVSSGTFYLKVLTGRGNVFTGSYPNSIPPYAEQAFSSGSLAVNLATFKFYILGAGQQSGGYVSGFVATALPITTNDIAFSVQFTNTDVHQRNITLWPSSEVKVMSIQTGSNGKNIQVSDLFLVASLSGGTNPTGVTAFTTPITVSYESTITLYFGSADAEGTTLVSTSGLTQNPFTAFFELNGVYSDGTFFGQTVPFPAGTVTAATTSLSSTSGASGSVITVSGTGFDAGEPGFIGWLTPASDSFTTLTTFTVVASGGSITDVPSGTTFTVPAVTPGYYVVVVSDYVNTLYVVFDVT